MTNKQNNCLELSAEIIGIMLGDGCLYLDKYHKYQTVIAFNKCEKNYLFYVKDLFEKLFQYKFCVTELKHEFLLRNNSVFIGSQLKKLGFKVGNKIQNRMIIPDWIMDDLKLIIRCLRGIFDTDGCVYNKYNNYAQIQFKMANKSCIKAIRKSLIKIKFNPTKLQEETYMGKKSWKIYLSRQSEIDRFFKLIKPKNIKNLLRYNKIRNGDTGI
jgi:DNA-binding transcriptional regulator WhiA